MDDGGGSRSQVERFRGNYVNGCYDGTLAQILALVNLKLKVMVASGDSDPDILALMGEKVLGHIWKPTEDQFVFKVKVNLSATKTKGQKVDADFTLSDIQRLPEIVLTKRVLLGLVMSQYDPMGLITPIIIIMKIRLRELYAPGLNLGWDEPLSGDLKAKWIDLITKLLHMGEIVLRRGVRPEGTVGKPEIIGFADGSLDAYTCSIYIRYWLRTVQTKLIGSVSILFAVKHG